MVLEARPVIMSLQRFDVAMTRQRWPDQHITIDVHALIAADGSLIADLTALSTLKVRYLSSWEATVSRDGRADYSVDSQLRQDLDLPQTPYY
jgi:hypothetical protein